MSSKMQKVKQSRWKEHCESLFTTYGNTGASITDYDDNEQGKSRETTDEDDEELIPLRSEVGLAVKQLKNGKATGCDDTSADMIKASGDLGISLLLHKWIFPIATYGCETWVLRKLDIKRINAFEMKCYRKIIRIPCIAHRANCSILNQLHLPTNWMYNFVRRQKLKYFGHVTRHDDLEKTIMQGMVAGKRSRGKPRHRWEKYITDLFDTMEAASRVGEDRHQFRRDIWAATAWRGYAPRREITYNQRGKAYTKTTTKCEGIDESTQEEFIGIVFLVRRIVKKNALVSMPYVGHLSMLNVSV